MRKPLRLAMIGLAAAVLGSAGLTGPAHAATPAYGHKMERGFDVEMYAIGTGRGYGWNNDPSAPLGIWNALSGGYVYNSNSSLVAINHTGAGTYTAWFPGLGPYGNVQVTAYGNDDIRCKVGAWRDALGDGTDIDVDCFNRHGQLADSEFTVSYNYLGDSPTGGYLYADQPTAAGYVPSPIYQGGAGSSITRYGTGDYSVKVGGFSGVGGDVQITAYGPSSDYCKVASWNPSAGAQYVTVLCYNTKGVPVDSPFSLAYVVNGSVLWGTPAQSAYVWADQQSAGGYAPSPAYTYDAGSSGANSINRLGTGQYGAHLATDLGHGTVHVTGYGWDNTSCKIAFWNLADGVRVNCFRPDGTPVDAEYDVAAVTLP